MSTVDLNVPPGTRLLLLSGEWRTDPTKPGAEDIMLTVVAVYRQAIYGHVWTQGHTCPGQEPTCGKGACFEGQVLVAAIRANLAGFR